MSRIAKNPVILPKNVQVVFQDGTLVVTGPKGTLSWLVPRYIRLVVDKDAYTFVPESQTGYRDRKAPNAWALSGTARALLNNMVIGVGTGFEKRLVLKGVGYRAQKQGDFLDLTLGFSHPVKYPIPKDIGIETPSNTEIVVSGIDKQRVGQVAADIRAYRKPDAYKGKGVRYADEVVILKEVKKK